MLNKYLSTYEIKKPDNFKFTKRNLIIGKNGIRKNTFLKAYRDYCYEECSIRNELIYVYFPALSAKYKKNFEEEDIDITLYEIINKDDDMSCDAIA